MKVRAGHVVRMHYTLRDENGATIESSVGRDPLSYLHGSSQIIPGLEKALDGSDPGTKTVVTVAPQDAYGHKGPRGDHPRGPRGLPSRSRPDSGHRGPGETPDGPLSFMVVSVDEKEAVLDANHPLAGKTLTFDVEILDVRKATQDELAHGHVHGPGGAHGHHGMSVTRRAVILVLVVTAAAVASPQALGALRREPQFHDRPEVAEGIRSGRRSTSNPSSASCSRSRRSARRSTFAIDALYSRTRQRWTRRSTGPSMSRESRRNTRSASARSGTARPIHAPILGRPAVAWSCSNLNLDSPVLAAQSRRPELRGLVEGGITWRFGKHVNLGFELRYSTSAASFESSARRSTSTRAVSTPEC
jgi:FKBP-type peptidyl-prolyl cis-trans isomerase SlyD